MSLNKSGHELDPDNHFRGVTKMVPLFAKPFFPDSYPLFDRAKARQAANALLEARKGVTLGGLSIKELVNEGRP